MDMRDMGVSPLLVVAPDRGPIGANCLANPRDFKTPEIVVVDLGASA